MNNSDINPFEALANQQLVAAAKRRHQAAERRANKALATSDTDAPMKLSPALEAQQERNAQMSNYRRLKRDARDELCHGPWGWQVSELMRALKHITIDNAQVLTDIVTAADWMRECDDHTRYAVLDLIAEHIMRVRVRNGLAPFDDALWGEEPTVFQVIRKQLLGV